MNRTAEASITAQTIETVSPRIALITGWHVSSFISMKLSMIVCFKLIRISLHDTHHARDNHHALSFLGITHRAQRYSHSQIQSVYPEFVNYKLCVRAANIKLVSIHTMNELNF